ncbi:MAG TPA: NUDIX hydrolase [Allosphingosinicella sp.]|nr:NUDIX hydrolase [Allosphingosinicella sp.]
MAATPERPVSRQPIPDHARVAYEGTLFDVVQWDQELFDGTVASFEKVKRPDTAYVIPVTAAGDLVIVEQTQSGSQTYYGLIGGRIEKDEAPEEAARRELLEEAGLRADGFELLDSFQFLPKIDWAIFVYVARGISAAENASPDAGEKIRTVTLSLGQFLNLLTEDRFGDLEIALRFLRRSATAEGLRSMTVALSP